MRAGRLSRASASRASISPRLEREIDTDVTGYDPGYLDRRSWSPDGRSLLFYDFPGIRLVIVDVETGRATELPWQVGLAPSWQRVGGD